MDSTAPEKNEMFTSVWNSSFIRILIYALFCQFTMAVSNTVLPLYVINGLGRSATESGLLGTLFTVGSLCCRFVSGYLCERFGRRKCLIAGALLVGLSLIALGFETTMFLLLFTKVIQGIGHALNSTASNAVAAEVLPTEQVGRGLGYYALHSTVTNAIGPTICLALMGVGAAAAGTQNYRLPLILGGVLGLIAMLIGASLRYESRMPAKAENAERRIRLSDFLEKRALLPAMMSFFIAFATGAGTYMIVFANDYQFSTIGLYYIVDAVVGVAVRFCFGKKLDALPPRRVALIAIGMNFLAYLLLGLTLSEWAFMLSAVLLGVYSAMLAPMTNAMAMKMVPESRTGSASSTYWLGFDIGMAIGMLFFGALIDSGGYKTAFIFSGVFMLLFGIACAFFLRRFVPIRDMQNPAE